MATEAENPKAFISYSWSGSDHESWVIQLATELTEAGVHVILDKWDLREGHDAYAFMEQMVVDPTIKKVLLVCDRVYAEKANKRTGGVGAEAQIITPNLYSTQDQSKFVAVIRERDESGKPYVPTYYASRIYIDLSEVATYAEEFERLLRWIYNKPLHKRPELGAKPAFLSEAEDSIRLPTTTAFRRAVDAIKGGKDHAIPALSEYLTLVADGVEKFRITNTAEPFDNCVMESIEAFRPYRNELIGLFQTIALYQDDMETRRLLHRFFESLIPYLDRSPNVNSWKDTDFDNFKFIVHELFLYCIACFLKHERFAAANALLQQEYYVKLNAEMGRDVMVAFTIFESPINSLQIRNQRLRLGRLSLSADIFKEHCNGTGIEFERLMEADFILFMRSQIDHPADRWWCPNTLVFTSRFARPFEIFARAKSTAYFDRIKVILGIEGKDALQPLLEAFESNPRSLPCWDYTSSFNPRALMGFDVIATKP